MSEQHTPPKWAIDAAKEINSIVDEREFDDDLITRIASVIEDAIRARSETK